TPEHIGTVAARLAGATAAARTAQPEPGVAAIYHHVPFAQDASGLMVGERTNANGSKAFREAMLAADFHKCVEIAREQARDGSHLLALCGDYARRAGAPPPSRTSSRPGGSRSAAGAWSTRSTSRTATVPAPGTSGSCRSCRS